MAYRNRREGGAKLAVRLAQDQQRYQPDPLVLGLPRGGVPVAYEVARALGAELGVFIVRKLGTPGQEELALGAIASGGIRVFNQEIIDSLRISPEAIERVTNAERQELERREGLYRGDKPPPTIRGRCVIVVDDGLATGATMRAAVAALRAAEPAKLVVAVPVGAAETCGSLEADETVCLETPSPFWGVGRWYADFSQTTDEEVRDLLAAGTNAPTSQP